MNWLTERQISLHMRIFYQWKHKMEHYKVLCSLLLKVFRQRLNNLSEKWKKEILVSGGRLELINSKFCLLSNSVLLGVIQAALFTVFS